MKDFVKNTADVININLNDSWASVILFSDKASIRFPLTKYTDLNSFRDAVDNIKYDEVMRSGTNTPDALKLLLNASQDGRLGLRNDTAKIVVMITDGRPNLKPLNILAKKNAITDTLKAATNLHNSSIYDQIYAVGIEGNKQVKFAKILKNIAHPRSLVFPITGFQATQFKELTRNLTLSFCNGKLFLFTCVCMCVCLFVCEYVCVCLQLIHSR